jgi:hypothetical protein
MSGSSTWIENLVLIEDRKPDHTPRAAWAKNCAPGEGRRQWWPPVMSWSMEHEITPAGIPRRTVPDHDRPLCHQRTAVSIMSRNGIPIRDISDSIAHKPSWTTASMTTGTASRVPSHWVSH